jgi:2-methylcitrate dehydratase PrpD
VRERLGLTPRQSEAATASSDGFYLRLENSGESHSTRVDVPKGDPRDPMTEEEIAVKFTALGGDVIGKEQCKKLQSYIMSLETAKDLGGLFELTTAR